MKGMVCPKKEVDQTTTPIYIAVKAHYHLLLAEVLMPRRTGRPLRFQAKLITKGGNIGKWIAILKDDQHNHAMAPEGR